jgi:2-polyprenyl-3-methyl-5-hydroxy-6-metoxy-1,4-benzoquinol methylase
MKDSTETKTASEAPARRTGDAIEIDGAYQHRALLSGPPVQRFWHESKLRLLDWFFPIRRGDALLDVGCGSGVFADAAAKRGARVVGVDANPAAVAYAETTFAKEGLSFRRGLLDELDIEDASFDRASALEIVEHVLIDQVRKLLADLFRIVKKGGEVLITTPNYRGLWPVIEWAADRFSKAAKMDGDQHVLHFRRRLLRDVLVEAGFEIVDLRTYCTFAPFAAGVSYGLANRLEAVERRIDLPFGCLLAARARKPR